MLLKPINRMPFNVFDMLSRRQSLLWQCVYITLLLILQICADNRLICRETAAARSQPCQQQFLMSKPKLINPPNSVSLFQLMLCLTILSHNVKIPVILLL